MEKKRTTFSVEKIVYACSICHNESKELLIKCPKCERKNSYQSEITSSINDYKKLLNELSRQIELYPLSADVYYHRGLFYIDNILFFDETEKAIVDFTSAIDLNYYYADAYFERGLIYHSVSYDGCLKEFVRKAISDFSRTIDLDQYNACAYYFRGQCYLDICDEEKALNDFNKALELNLKIDYITRQIYIERGICFEIIGKYDDAIKDYTHAIELEPDSIIGYTKRAKVYAYYLKEYESALKDYAKACKLEPYNCELREKMYKVQNYMERKSQLEKELKNLEL